MFQAIFPLFKYVQNCFKLFNMNFECSKWLKIIENFSKLFDIDFKSRQWWGWTQSSVVEILLLTRLYICFFTFLLRFHLLELLVTPESAPDSWLVNLDDHEFAVDYYFYEGSLTTPPCTENVHWFVNTGVYEISQQEYASLGKEVPGTNRPLQDLNDREITIVKGRDGSNGEYKRKNTLKQHPKRKRKK